jgi:hypothetical protein
VSAFRVDFQPGGIKDVQQAFKTVLQATLDAGKGLVTSAKEGDAAWKQLEREIVRNRNRTLAAIEKVNREIERDAQRAADKEVAIARKAAADREKIEENYQKVRHHTEERYRQEAEFRAENSLRARAVATMKGQYRNALSGTVQQGMSHVGAAAQLATGVFGGFSVADSVANMNKFQSSVAALSNATYIPDQKDANGKIISAGTARAKASDIEAVAREGEAASGYSKQELVDAWSAYIEKSSDSAAFVGDDPVKRKESKTFLVEMAQLAKGSGANIADVMNAAGVLQVQNENMSAADRATTMRNIVGQGKLGAISMPDLAKAVPKITASSSQFAMGTTEAQRALLGISQIAVQTAGTAPVAATAVANMVGETGKKHDKIKSAFGVETKDAKTKKLLDPSIWLADLMEKVGGDTSKLQKVYGAQSIRVFTALAGTFNEARDAALKDGKSQKEADAAGGAAVRKKVGKFEAQGYSKEDAAADFATTMATREEKFKKAKLQTQNAIEEALLPALEAFARVVPEITPKLVAFIKFLTENPFQGAGILVGASIAKQMAAAGIQSIMEKALGGVGGPVALAVVAGMLAWKTMEASLDKEAAERTKRGQTGATAEGLIHDAKKAKTPEEQQKAIAALEEHGQMLNEQSGKVAEGKDHSAHQMAAKAARLVMGVQSFGLSETKGAAGDQLGEGIAQNDRMAAVQSAQLAKEGTELVAVIAQFREKLAKATAGAVGGPAPTVPMSQRTSPDH